MGLVVGVWFVMVVVWCAGSELVGVGGSGADFSAGLYMCFLVGGCHLGAGRKLLMCLWEKIMVLLVSMHRRRSLSSYLCDFFIFDDDMY